LRAPRRTLSSCRLRSLSKAPSQSITEKPGRYQHKFRDNFVSSAYIRIEDGRVKRERTQDQASICSTLHETLPKMDQQKQRENATALRQAVALLYRAYERALNDLDSEDPDVKHKAQMDQFKHLHLKAAEHLLAIPSEDITEREKAHFLLIQASRSLEDCDRRYEESCQADRSTFFKRQQECYETLCNCLVALKTHEPKAPLAGVAGPDAGSQTLDSGRLGARSALQVSSRDQQSDRVTFNNSGDGGGGSVTVDRATTVAASAQGSSKRVQQQTKDRSRPRGHVEASTTYTGH
jgi:hypothetical protein